MKKQGLSWQSDSWLSTVLERPVFLASLPRQPSRRERDRFQQWLASGEPGFVSVKMSLDDTLSHRWLGELGFTLMDVVVTLEKDRQREPVVAPDGYTLRWAQPTDEAIVVDLARRSFRCSRWHVDPGFSAAQADIVKAEWARNYFRGKRGQGMAVVTFDEEPVGFLQLLVKNDTLILDLLAVDEAQRGRGLGSALVEWAQAAWADAKIRRVEVGTQERNVPALALYRSLGFVEIARNTMWHWHRQVVQSKVRA